MIVFDFDGVLIDSAAEVVVTAYNNAADALVYSHDQIPRSFIELFVRNRCRPRSAGEIAVFGKWCLEHHAETPPDLMSAERFSEILETASVPLEQLEQQYFVRRGELFEKHPREWLELNSPYQPLWDELLKRDCSEMVILTYKNHEAVLKICRHYGMKLNPENVYSADGGISKQENFSRIVKRFHCTHISLIDDAVRNLCNLKQQFGETIELDLNLASWGYVAPDDISRAEAEGIRNVTQSEFVVLLDR